jgi:hypothetical protein
MKIMAKNLACAIVAVCSLTAASPALAQSRVWEGSVLPVFFDSLGERHYDTYGYYGSLDPPLACGSDEQAVVPARAAPRRTDEAAEYPAGYTLACSDGCREDEIPAARAQGKPALKLRSDGNGRRE